MNDHIELKLDKTNSIDELFDEVKDHDLVLTVDAPLADALNARLTTPRLGHFATTPRRLALNEVPAREKFQDKRKLFIKIQNETDLNWKHASYLFENIVNCWMETGNPDKVLNEYNTEAVKKIIKILKETVNQYSAAEDYTVPEDIDLAVVALHQFTELDKKVLPENYDVIGPFKRSETSLPKFNVFNSTTEIVETILDQIKKVDPRDIAVVMKKDCDYRYLLEAIFQSKDIPYMVSKDITESESVRKFLNLIRISFYRSGIKIKDIRSLTENEIDPKVEDHFLHSFDDPVKDLIDDISNLTFEELLNKDYFEEDLKELKNQLKDTGLFNKKITLDRLNSLTYYLETFDIKTKTAGQGVLIASPSTSTYIDRPTIFYLGMSSSWTPEPPSMPWIDEKEFDKRKIEDFKILLQNGERRYFLVQDKKMNQTITPSFYFNEFTDDNIESFRDLKHELDKKDITPIKEPFTKQQIKASSKQVKTLSQSALNTFAYCPKDRFFSELVTTPDNRYFRRGTVLHHLAEYLVNYPDSVDKKEDFLDKMMEELTPFLEEYQMPNMKTRFEVGFQNIVDFLNLHEPKITDPEGYKKKYTDNIFADLLNRPVTTNFTEVSFNNEDIGANGKLDLVLAHDLIVDHKTGPKKSKSTIMKKSDIDDIDSKPNFQAKLYLAHHRHHNPGIAINFTFFHMLDNERDVVSGTADLYDNIVNVEYHPREFNEMVQDKMMFEWLKSSKYRKKVLNKLGYDDYCSFFKDEDIPDLEKDELVEHPITKEFIDHCQNKIGSYAYVKDTCESIMKQFVKFRSTRYFKSDLDRFEIFLKNKINEYNEYRKTTFPVGDIDPQKIDNKDLVIL
ncbi:MAG: PD-(D/E)XK nuclease family protein [Candidatus Saliniplasma sp.]